jgi:hypothetical protein
MTENLEKKWIQWFSGFIDGDGSILVYKDHVSIEATTSFDEQGILSSIKTKFGGSIKTRSNANALRWRTRKKDVILKILFSLNGLLYNTLRWEQYQNACIFYKLNIENSFKNISAIESDKNIDNAYLSGLFDADGTITISVNWKLCPKHLINISGLYGKIQRLIYSRGFHQCQIKCTSKYQINIEQFKTRLNLGDYYFEKNKQGHIKWHWILKQNEIPQFLLYLEKNPLKGKKKKNRFYLLSKYFKLKNLKAHLAEHDSAEFKEWKKFCYAWYNYQDIS